MSHFTIKDMMRDETAKRKRLKNKTSDPNVLLNMNTLIMCILNPLQERFMVPIIIESGYRSTQLNKLVGGTANSQHLVGRAADIRPVYGSENYSEVLQAMFEWLRDYSSFDQLIYYPRRGFIHVSYVSVKENRNQIFIRSISK